MSNLGQMALDLHEKPKRSPSKKKQESSSSSEPELRFPRDVTIHNFKCEGQGTEEQFTAYNKRSRKIKQLQRKWNPYQKTLDQLQQQYEAAVQAVREQAKHIDDEIKQLQINNTDNCPHPINAQEFDEKHLYFEWDQRWEIDEWTNCGLCKKTILFKRNGQTRK